MLKVLVYGGMLYGVVSALYLLAAGVICACMVDFKGERG